MTQIGNDPSSLELKVPAQLKRWLIQHKNLRNDFQKTGLLYDFLTILILHQIELGKLLSDGSDYSQLLDLFGTITAKYADQTLDFIDL